MRSAIVVAAIGLMSLACGPSRVSVIVSTPAQEGPQVYCRLQGTWTSGRMEAPRSGFEYARVHAVPYRAQLDRTEGELRLHTVVNTAGWTLGGRVDPDAGELRAASPMWLAAGVGVSAGTAVTVRDARPGEVEFGLSRFAPDEDDGVRFATPPTRWVPCAALSMSFEHRDDDTPRDERVAFDLPRDPPTMTLSSEATASLAETPGGPAFVQLGPREYRHTLLVLEEQGVFSRVLLHHWTGTLVLGWVPTAALQPRASGTGGLGVLGGVGDPVTEDVCTSPERLVVSVSQEGSPEEPVGVVEAATQFRRFTVRDDGAASIAPIRSAKVSVSGEGVRWWVRPQVPLSCVSQRHDPAESFRQALGPPTVELRLFAEVEAVEGLPTVSAGDTCEVVVAYREGRRYPCQATVACGDAVLYGARPSNGFFECELDAAGDPTIRGQDTQTSHASGDPAMRIDTGEGTIIVEEDAESTPGPYRLEARLQPAPGPDR